MSRSRTAYSVQRTAFIIIVTLLFATNCYAVVWSSNELIEKAKELNGRKLNYRGELITAILGRGEYSWINLNDGSNAIGVWCSSPLLGEVKFAGDYKRRGDIIEVNGTLNRACSLHNGELDIHADTIKIVKKGYSFIRTIDLKRINSAAVLFAFTILTVVIFRKRL
jgi:lysyl-tRNA synthetase class II